MGLAGRKEKQRFGIDPQNKQWQNNKDAIGFKLLSQMGWQEGKGLGKARERRERLNAHNTTNFNL